MKGAPNFFLGEMKAQRDEGDGRILLGDNTGGGGGHVADDQGPVCVEFGFKLCYFECTYIVDRVGT